MNASGSLFVENRQRQPLEERAVRASALAVSAHIQTQLPKLPEIRRIPRRSRSWPACWQVSPFTPLEFQLKHQTQTPSSSRPYLIDRKRLNSNIRIRLILRSNTARNLQLGISSSESPARNRKESGTSPVLSSKTIGKARC
jgi:hypothetical protein